METKDQSAVKEAKGAIYTIDAKGKRLGRVASEASHVLMGKDAPSFAKNIVADVTVEIVNAGALNILPRKLDQKKYTRYSGYPGGLKQRTMRSVVEQKGHAHILERAIYGMLPANRLRKERMKHLSITL